MNYKDSDKFLLLFRDCIPVKGATKSTICDLTRNKIDIIPSSYYNLLEDFEKSTISDVYKSYDSDQHESIDTFIKFLFTNEFCILVDDISLFPKIESVWESPELINNIIIDIDQQKFDFVEISKQLDQLNCRMIQLRFYSNVYALDEVLTILNEFVDTSIKGAEVLLKYDPAYTDEEYSDFFERNLLISSLIIHSAPSNKTLDVTFGGDEYDEKNLKTFRKKIFFSKEVLTNSNSCGKISKSYFCVSSVSDAMHNSCHNSCLNKKISIDVNGEIKNCPSMAKSFGNISSDSLMDASEAVGFKDLWSINKEKIEDCNICEYRLVCTDCRAFVENPENMFSKPLKCGYNPRTGEWSDWESDPNKRNAIAHYNLSSQ